MVGKAGTGKTTTIKEYVRELVSQHLVAPMRSVDGHKYLKSGSFGVVCCAFTNRAINNISKSFDLGSTQINFRTIHKLLEYIREECVVKDKITGEMRSSFRFVPSRTAYNKLPQDLKIIIIEEASMVNYPELFKNLIAACHSGIQFIYLGDLQQLPPIGGDGVLGYKLNEHPVFELTQIYRQAAENPIIRFAWDIAQGEVLTKEILEKKYLQNKSLEAPIRMTFFDKKIDYESACIVMGKFFCTLLDRGIFNPDEDIILVPYNKKLGSIELNKKIAQHISEKAGHETYQIIAGYQKHYYAIGDKVLYNKKEAIITKITKNGRYIGKKPLPANIYLHRDGNYQAKDNKGIQINPEHMTEEEVDNYLNVTMESTDEDISNQASHIVHINLLYEQMEDGSEDAEISTRGEYGNLELAYAITIHKAQGSEWRKVFLLLHNSHYHICRELLYTAVTRASQQLFIMCESDSFTTGISRQRITGNTLKEKIQWFKEKIEEKARGGGSNSDEEG